MTLGARLPPALVVEPKRRSAQHSVSNATVIQAGNILWFDVAYKHCYAIAIHFALVTEPLGAAILHVSHLDATPDFVQHGNVCAADINPRIAVVIHNIIH